VTGFAVAVLWKKAENASILLQNVTEVRMRVCGMLHYEKKYATFFACIKMLQSLHCDALHVAAKNGLSFKNKLNVLSNQDNFLVNSNTLLYYQENAY